MRRSLAMKCEACSHDNIEGARFCASCGALLPLERSLENPLIGQLIGGRYRITGVLGEGGMGIVYVGEQQMGSTIRKVAVKTLHAHLSKDPSVLARFHRECGTVAQLEHPNTIKFYDFGATQDGTLYIAMEFVAGKPLSQVLESEGAFTGERTLRILRQICGALDEAHQLGIIHRDLKPDNIILTNRAGEPDFVKVLDFGIAARTESADAQREQKLTQQGMVLGTPPYMSPEQFTGKALDKRSDIYSLGVMTYQMLTARLPFEADTPWQWATQHMTAQPLPFEATAPAANIPDSMRRAILRALSKKREDRQDSARQFFLELSDGSSVTGDRPARASASGTAAMGAPPNFGAPGPGGAMAPTAGMDASALGYVAGAQPAAYASPAYGSAAAVQPYTKPSGKGSGKGLLFGLLGLGMLLLIGIGVFAARSLKPSAPDEPLVNPAASTSAVATIVPQTDLPDAAAAAGPALEASRRTPSTAEHVATAKPRIPKSEPKETEPPPPALSGAAACEACIRAAEQGNLIAAAAHLGKCEEAAKKQRCRSLAVGSAPGAVRAAAFNGNCQRARSLAAAARSFGVGDVSSSMGSCK